jgi:predicted dehydrogenase
LTAEFKEIGVEMAGVCDVYEPNLQLGLKAASSGAKGFGDYRRVLDDKSFDVVIIATPDHWHAQMTIDAVDAGKDVYVEKPLAHTIPDGFRMIDAVRRTGRVVQLGTQRRSFDLFLEGKQVYDGAGMGDVRLVTGYWNNRQEALNTRQLEGRLDWEQWLGSAPKREANAQRFFNWYWFFDYSGGLMIGQCAHAIDAIHWFRGLTYPKSVFAAGVKAIAGAEVPETTTLLAEYESPAGPALVNFTVGYQAMRYSASLDQIKQFHGTRARFDQGRDGFSLYREDPRAVDLKPEREVKRPGAFASATRQHIHNFLECVRDRKQPNATVEMGQWTNVVLCLGMESLKTGRRFTWDAASRKMA